MSASVDSSLRHPAATPEFLLNTSNFHFHSTMSTPPSADLDFDLGVSWSSNSTSLTTAKSAGLPVFYEPLYKAIGCALVAVIFAVGLVGNLMVVLVVWRTRSMRTPTNCYLVSLAVADILLLITASPPTIVEFFIIVDQVPLAELFGSLGCAVMVGISPIGS